METTFKGYRIRTSGFGYSVYKDDLCVAGGGVFGGERVNLAEGKRAIAAIQAGTRKPLNLPSPSPHNKP